MQAEIREQPAIRAAGIRHVGPYSAISEAFARLGPIAGRAGLYGPDTLMLAIYHDDPTMTAESALRSDAAVSIADGIAMPDGLSEQRVPAGRYLTARHVGPYDGIAGTWQWLMSEGVKQTGARRRPGPSYEVYRNNPMDTPPDRLITEICIPVA